MENEHLFMVSASDGLWEFMTSQEVVDMAKKHEDPEVTKNLAPSPPPPFHTRPPDPAPSYFGVCPLNGSMGAQVAVNELIKEAKTRWLKEEEVIDDTTVVMACIGGWRGEP